MTTISREALRAMTNAELDAFEPADEYSRDRAADEWMDREERKDRRRKLAVDILLKATEKDWVVASHHDAELAKRCVNLADAVLRELGE